MMFSFVECTYPIKLPFTLKVKCRNRVATIYMNIHTYGKRLLKYNYLNQIYEMFYSLTLNGFCLIWPNKGCSIIDNSMYMDDMTCHVPY